MLARGEKELEIGKGYDLKEVMKEADKLLERTEVFRIKAEKVLSRLNKFPLSGRLLPEFPDLPFREVIVPPYRFFYRLKGKVCAWIWGPC